MPGIACFRNERLGFTLIESVVAVVVIVIALGGIIGLVGSITRRGRAPDDLAKASYFAAERLSYFRSHLGREASGASLGSANGFIAAGGTYYPPPSDPRAAASDPNRDPRFHNVAINKVPTLFVREYLYDPTETLSFDELAGESLGERNRKRRYVSGERFVRNEIPTTPAMMRNAVGELKRIARVVPNPEDAAPPPPASQPDGSIVIPAPRTNAHIPGPAGSLADPTLRFVREVWVQVLHPLFGIGTAAALPGAPKSMAAPPYSVVVTVRVYAKDRRVREYAPVPSATTPNRGPGYDPRKPPLAEMAGCIGVP